MNWNKFKDSREVLPEEPGKYVWFSKLLGNIPIIWDGENFKTLSGDILSKKTVRYWR